MIEVRYNTFEEGSLVIIAGYDAKITKSIKGNYYLKFFDSNFYSEFYGLTGISIQQLELKYMGKERGIFIAPSLELLKQIVDSLINKNPKNNANQLQGEESIVGQRLQGCAICCRITEIAISIEPLGNKICTC